MKNSGFIHNSLLQSSIAKFLALLLITYLLAMPDSMAQLYRKVRLGEWNFNTGSTTESRLNSSNVVQGLTLSGLSVNSSVVNAGVGGIPSNNDDGMGFGGNNGVETLFWRRASYTNTNAPVGKITSWGVPGVDSGVNTTVAGAPMSFTVTAALGQTLIVESLLIANSSGSGACRTHFQEAGQAVGSANLANSREGSRVLVPLKAPVEVSPGTTKTFTINWSGDALSIGQNIDSIDLRGSIRSSGERQTVKTRYSVAASTSTPPAGWSFKWNAPNNWVAGVSPGILSRGVICNTASWRPMVWRDGLWSADGNSSGTDSSPDNYIRIDGVGGHPGSSGATRCLDRYAISVFSVDTAGDYQIGKGWIEKFMANGNGLLLKIYAKGRLVKTIDCPPAKVTHFDARIEDLAVGDQIAVAVGSNGHADHETYGLDYEIALCDPTFDGLPVFDVASFGAVGNGTTDDFQAIQAAVNAARAANGGIIRFDGKKKYRAIGNSSPDTLVETLFELKGAFNIKIEGNGASLLLHPPDEFCDIDYSENIQINGFTVSFDPAIYYQGIIDSINVGNLTMDITVPNRYAIPETGNNTAPSYFPFFGRGFIPNTPGARWGESYHLFIDSTETIGGNPRKIRLKFRSDMTSHLQNSLAATEMIVPHIRYGQRWSGSVSITSSSRVKLSNILYHQSPYILCVSQLNTGPVTLSNFDVLTTNPRTELFVSWRDLFHIKDNAYGVLFEGGDWDGGACYDDTFNFSSIMNIVDFISGNQLKLKNNNYSTWFAGEWISIWDPTQTILRGRARIVAPGSTDTMLATLTLDRAITASADDWVVNDHQTNRGMLVRDCRMRRIGGSAGTMRISTPTTFKNVHLDGCYMRFYTTYEHEGPKPRGMRIENMYIRGGGPSYTLTRPVVVLEGTDLVFKNCTIDAGELYSDNKSEFSIDHTAWINNTAKALILNGTQAHVFNNSTRNGVALASSHATISNGGQLIFQLPAGYPASTGYDVWARSYSLQGVAAGPNYDADSDGAINLKEYAHGGNPIVHDSSGIWPTHRLNSDQSIFHHFHKERIDDKGLSYSIESSTNLKDDVWFAGNIITVLSETPINSYLKKVTSNVNVNNKGFIRLKIDQQAIPCEE